MKKVLNLDGEFLSVSNKTASCGKGAFKKSLPTLSQIRTTHNSFARQTLFEFDSKKAEKDDDVFHFVRQERFYKSFLVKDIKF